MKFTIIGGGIGGCATALELANAGHEVEIIEIRDNLLSGSSDDTPCRLGLGFHYIDEETATKYLHATIKVAKTFPGFIVAQDRPSNHPYRRWRYFITKDSLFPLRKIEGTFDALKQEYEKLVKEDPTNAVFGDPTTFFQPLSVDEFQGDINTKKVIAGYETAEQVLDWPKFKEYLINEIEHHPKITVHKNTEVSDIKQSDTHAGFTLKVKKDKQTESTVEGDFIINSSWENIESLTHKAGFFTPSESRTNRLKVIVEIKLPEDFEKEKSINSMFFCFGPHCSFTNLGNGTGFISYEPVTNIASSTALEVPDLFKRLLYEGASEQEKLSYAQRILDGVTEYIPGLKDSKFLSAKFGIVKTKGSVDIFSPSSDFHKRNYSGIEEQQIRWIDNPCMKLLYFLDNAASIKQSVEQHLRVDEAIDNILVRVKNLDKHHLNEKVIKHALTKNLQRYLRIDDLTTSEVTNDNAQGNDKVGDMSDGIEKVSSDLNETIEHKYAVIQEISMRNN